MTKVKLFYANGTSWAINFPGIIAVAQDFGAVYVGDQVPGNIGGAVIPGINGRSAQWNGAPQHDPFPQLLDPDKFEAVRIQYPASMIGMGQSIDWGITQTVNAIKAMPAGQPFALGGYSQGAAVMSGVYNQIRSGSLTSRASSFLGGVMFGNPRRQVNYRGPIGGTWSGAWDVANSTTGGHGSFPATGPWARLTNCDAAKWVEFAYPNDVITSVGDSTIGQNWSLGNGELLSLDVGLLLNWLLTGAAQDIGDAVNAAFTLGNQTIAVVDGAGKTLNWSGNGHVAYPLLPPYGLNGESCYQLALRWLDGLANAYVTAPILAPKSSAGWSTTLLPPSA